MHAIALIVIIAAALSLDANRPRLALALRNGSPRFRVSGSLSGCAPAASALRKILRH
jgi:hypothetical protein